MAHYSIKDLEKMSGILAHTIRIWEKRYKLIVPQRTDTNIRVYTDLDLKKILNVSLLNRNGLKISKIAKLSEKDLSEQILKLTSDTQNPDSQIETLVQSMIEFDGIRIEQILADLISKNGMESTVLDVVYPFLRKTGALWQTGKVNPAQEHFATNIIRRKLFAAIDALPNNDNKEKFLIYLPEGEFHEIAMLFYFFLIKKHGYNAIYLGQSVPFADVVESQQRTGAEYVLTSFITTLQDFSFTEYALNMSKVFKKSKSILVGEIAANLELKRITNLAAVRNPDDFLTFLNKLK